MLSRSESDIAGWERHFESQVWYSRHMLRAAAIADGRIALVHRNDQISSNQADPISIEIWQRACRAATNIEKELEGDIGPWTDYEWGKLNGKLSALRWILGLPWDMLDT